MWGEIKDKAIDDTWIENCEEIDDKVNMKR